MGYGTNEFLKLLVASLAELVQCVLMSYTQELNHIIGQCLQA